jgi:DNA polymerase-1
MLEGKKRLIIFDSNSIIHRAFHALPPLTTKKGELVNAVYGFLLVFFKVLREFKPDFVVATFDFPAPTFRHQEFKEYKATRPKAPDELYNQIPKVKEILNSFNVPIFEKEGFEADDLIGTISRLAPKKQILPEIETIILSGDLDTLQLINRYTKVYALKKGVKETILYDERAVRERYGLSPEQLVDFKALKGDPSDNIPGVPGIGEKTAIKLIKEFGNLENLYSSLTGLNQCLRTKLEEYKDQAFFSKNLAKINQNIEIDFDFKNGEWKNYDREKVTKILKDLEFFSLIARLPTPEAQADGGQERLP